jgi:Holliday junction resolvase RusA-like endonuclease
MTARRTVAFQVDGLPAAQGSKTVGRSNAGQLFVREASRALAPWRLAIALAARQAMNGTDPFTGPLLLVATFRFPRPKAHYRTGRHAGELKLTAPELCATRPDLDKLLRALGDAVSGIVCHDDAQICEVDVVKVYGQPGLHAAISELEP